MNTVNPVAHEWWPRGFSDTGHWGPSFGAECPCGSGLIALACHANTASGGWRAAELPPLIAGPRTGVSHPRCYARASEDCSSKVSNEHWLSKGVLLEAGSGKPLVVSGFAWQKGMTSTLPAQALGAKVLCERHNNALSPLDTLARHVLTNLRGFQSDLGMAGLDPRGSLFALFSGDDFERWMLKMMWGGCSAGVFGKDGIPTTRLRVGVDQVMLADYLFRRGALPVGWGLYAVGVEGLEVSAEADIAVTTLAGPDADVWGMSLEFGVVKLNFALGTPDQSPGVTVSHHPQAVFMSDPARVAQKVMALSWASASSHPVTWTFVRRTDR